MNTDHDDAAESVPLSVVVIAENEEDRVRECIESVFAACRRAVPAFEVILVDSASTDRTVERASEYPVTVLRIPEKHVVSCGAGRYVGEHRARGEMILHVDGDLTLTETWLQRAVEYLRDHDVGAVGGYLDEVRADTVQEADFVGGITLFDADALRSVGGFDPYLLGYEDVDVGYRLWAAGHRVVRLPAVAAYHPEREAFFGPIARWRAGYYIAPGQAIRKWLTSPPELRKLLRRQRYKLALLGWLALGAVSLAATPLLLGWLALSVVGFAAVARERGVAGAAEFVMVKAFGIVGLAVGLGRETPPPASYPLEDVGVVAEAGPTVAGDAQSAASDPVDGR